MTNGIKIAQQGIDVNTAPDYELIMSTEWPQLVIEAQGVFSIPANSSNVIICEHDLGYPPVFMIFTTSQPSDFNFTGISLGQSQLDISAGVVNNNTLTVGNARTVPFTGYFYIFKQNLNSTIKAPVGFPQPSPGKSTTNIGIEVSGSNIASQITSASNLHPMAIHMMGSAATDQSGVPTTIVHNLGYPPVFLLYGAGTVPGTFSMVNYRATFTPDAINYRGVQSLLPNPTQFVIIKDPVLQ